MKKRIFALCIAVMMCILSFVVFAYEDTCRLQDMAGLLSDDEYDEILAMLDDVSEKNGMDIVIMTVDETEIGFTVEEDATERYEDMGFDVDGVMLYISMEDRDWYILTGGYGMTAVDRNGIEYISESFMEDLSDGYYKDAFSTFITSTDEVLNDAEYGNVSGFDEDDLRKVPFDLVKSLLISLVIGFVISLVITGVWKSQLKSVAFQTRASDYMKHGSLNIEKSRDLFLYRTLDRREKPKTSSGGTHKSSSGRTYGGGGGKF